MKYYLGRKLTLLLHKTVAVGSSPQPAKKKNLYAAPKLFPPFSISFPHLESANRPFPVSPHSAPFAFSLSCDRLGRQPHPSPIALETPTARRRPHDADRTLRRSPWRRRPHDAARTSPPFLFPCPVIALDTEDLGSRSCSRQRSRKFKRYWTMSTVLLQEDLKILEDGDHHPALKVRRDVLRLSGKLGEIRASAFHVCCLPFASSMPLNTKVALPQNALTKYCTDNLPQTRSKRVMNVMHDDATLVPTIIPQEGRVPVKRTCLPTQKSASRAEILEEGPLDNGANEQEFPSSVGVDERLSNDIHESNSSNVQASSTSISKVRKTRGPTQMTAFQPPQGMKWTCMFIRGQPIGEPSSKLAGTLGLYARNESYFSPYKKWKQQSMQSFNDVHFEFVNQEGMPANMEEVNKFCFRSLQIKLKEWRSELKKKGYMKGENEELSREKLGDSYTTLEAYIKAHQTKSGDYPNEHTRSKCEKVIEACQEKDLMSSSKPAILSPILDGVCNGHHGEYERGCGLGWSRMSRWGDIGNQASNDNIKQLTLELKNAKAEIEAMHAREKEREEAMQAREREMQGRMERMEAMFTMHFSNSSAGTGIAEFIALEMSKRGDGSSYSGSYHTQVQQLQQ
ncbi:hypothetical protein Taro_027513 [Colocasia esculenta]|uniref:Uncharacterized protein n=1 Tax=Colocasia esculenta TaxID=4460 RepID=A0A843VMQ3_COLES|nr:hypothetical protein [Colocasia esculenta]